MIKKLSFGCLGIFLIAALAAFGTYWAFSGGFSGTKNKVTQRISNKDMLKGRTTIMLMGVDERVDDVGRSDTLMVLMVDPKTEKVDLLSIPRDTLVNIPGVGWDKINHAYAHGGHNLTKATVEDFLGIQINHYVMVDLKGFISIVDAIGGININVESRMYYEDPWDDDGGLVIDFQPGMQHMNGKEAMQYVRYRDPIEADIGRIRRQQQFIKAVYEKITSPANAFNLPKLTSVLFKMLQTDLSITEAAPIMNTLRSAVKNGLAGNMIPGDPQYIGEVSYWIPDIYATRDLIAKIHSGSTSGFESDTKSLASLYKSANPPRNETETSKKLKDKNLLNNKLDPKLTDKNKTTTKDKPTNKNQTTDKTPKTEQQTTAEEPATNWDTKTLRVVLVKCTDNPEAINRMHDILDSRNMQVVATRNGEIRQSTSVVSSTNNQGALNRLFRLPFPNSLRAMSSSDSNVDVVIFIGKDFN